MDGLTLTRRLKADRATASIPIVVLSAHAMSRDIEQAREAGCVDFITKPITDDPSRFWNGSPVEGGDPSGRPNGVR